MPLQNKRVPIIIDLELTEYSQSLKIIFDTDLFLVFLYKDLEDIRFDNARLLWMASDAWNHLEFLQAYPLFEVLRLVLFYYLHLLFIKVYFIFF